MELSEPETFKDQPKGAPSPGIGTAFQANECTFNVRTSWDDDPDGDDSGVIEAESVEVVE